MELNPSGSDSGNEWLELYSQESISLEGYSLENEDGSVYELNGSIINYLIIQFSKQWLDNSNASVKIKKDNSTIYQTSTLADSKNNELTFNLCNGEYVLKESSKGSENSCSPKQNTQQVNYSKDTQNNKSSNQNANTENKDVIIANVVQETSTKKTPQSSNNNQTIEDNKIFLNSNNVNKENYTTYTSKEDKTRLYIVYAFTAICIVMIILLARKKL